MDKQNDDDYDIELSQEEIKQHEDMDKKMEGLNSKLQTLKKYSDKLGLNAPDLFSTPFAESNKDINIDKIPTIDTRGNIILSNDKVHENYENQWPILKYLELPYCKKSIYSKCKFWAGMSLGIAYFFEAKHSIESNKGLKGVRFQPLMKKYFFFAALSMGLSIIESVYFEDYCDVNSYHYANDINRRKILEDIRERYKKK